MFFVANSMTIRYDTYMHSRQFGPEGHLPPLDVWKINPRHLRRIAPVTDDRGFVLARQTAEKVVERFIDDSYEWPVVTTRSNHPATPNRHHVHWPRDAYDPAHFEHAGALAHIPLAFRELRTQMVILPPQLHHLHHEVTHETTVPRIEPMERYVRGHRALTRLARDAERLVEITDRHDEARLRRAYRKSTRAVVGMHALEALRLEYTGDLDSATDVAKWLQPIMHYQMTDLTTHFPTREIDSRTAA